MYDEEEQRRAAEYEEGMRSAELQSIESRQQQHRGSERHQEEVEGWWILCGPEERQRRGKVGLPGPGRRIAIDVDRADDEKGNRGRQPGSNEKSLPVARIEEENASETEPERHDRDPGN